MNLFVGVDSMNQISAGLRVSSIRDIHIALKSAFQSQPFHLVYVMPVLVKALHRNLNQYMDQYVFITHFK